MKFIQEYLTVITIIKFSIGFMQPPTISSMVSIEYRCGLKYFCLTFAFQNLGKLLIKFHRTERGTRGLTYEPRVRDRSIHKILRSTNCTNCTHEYAP